jgi:hypothetical protein
MPNIKPENTVGLSHLKDIIFAKKIVIKIIKITRYKMTDNTRNHREEWTSEELEIVYKNYGKKTFKEIAKMIPTRSFSAVKNKVKTVMFGKYKKNKNKRFEKEKSNGDE